MLGRTPSPPGLELAWHKYMLGLLAKGPVVGGKVISWEFPITKRLFYKNFLRRQGLNYLWNRGAILFHLCGHLICFSITFHLPRKIYTSSPPFHCFTFNNLHTAIRCFYSYDFLFFYLCKKNTVRFSIFKATL